MDFGVPQSGSGSCTQCAALPAVSQTYCLHALGAQLVISHGYSETQLRNVHQAPTMAPGNEFHRRLQNVHSIPQWTECLGPLKIHMAKP